MATTKKKPPAKKKPPLTEKQIQAVTKTEPVKLQQPQIESIIKTTQDLIIVSKFAYESEFFAGIDSPAKASMVIEKGRELGIHTVSACQVIHPIKTQDGIKLAIEAKLYGAQAMDKGIRWKKIKKDAEACILEIYSVVDKTIPLHTETFTMKDAARANLSQKNNWVWYPEEMCYNRCLIKGLRYFDPRICMGLYSVEEVLDFEKITNEEGDEIYVIPEDMLGNGKIPQTDAAPSQTVAQTLPEEQVKGTGRIEEDEIQEVLDAEEVDDPEEEEEDEEEYTEEPKDTPVTTFKDAREAMPPELIKTASEGKEMMPFDEPPSKDELDTGKRDLAPEQPVDPKVLIYKEVVVSFLKVQLMHDKFYTIFKEWLSVFQTSRDPMRVFVARNRFGKWSLSEGRVEDLQVLAEHIYFTIEQFLKHCFVELKLKEVGIHKNPALEPKQE